MSTFVVWMDMDLAKLFEVKAGDPNLKVLHRDHIAHHTSRDPENHKDGEKFFHQIALALKGAGEVLVVGPGLAKDHFVGHLKRHHHLGLADKIVGTETVDHITDGEVMALSRKFFRLYDIYGKGAADLQKNSAKGGS